ncbi:MAG: short-chain dehydrogenase/reductase [Flavobacteriaceae bacterium]|nr:MAG: short-chain dehydrogenase/reductase [Flavobacteriaceae bacterium]
MSKVVLITGGSSGIGKAVGEFLTKKGFNVYGTSRDASQIKNHPFPLVSLDVRKPSTIESAVATVIKNEGRLDVLINNAGMGITGPIEETDTEEMRRLFDTNFFGAIDVMKAVLPQMRSQQSGLIINVTSIAGYMGLPFRGVYSASKGALELVTEALRMEVKQFGVQITNVAPGDFATNIAAGRYHAPVIKKSPYEASYQLNLDLMNAHVDGGKDPEIMAKAIFSIITKNTPRIHYKVGEFMQKFSIVLKRILPDTWYEKLLMNHYKL